MELESYFDFPSPEEIRIKGTRIAIETVLEDYFEGASPEEIAIRYRSLRLEQVYAALLYYLRHRSQMDGYLEAWRAHAAESWAEHERQLSPAVQHLRGLKARRAALQEKAATP
jgi:uncharacterized protein (DUF433 family)